MKLIGITGKTGSGKSTFARILSQKLNGIYINIDRIGHQATSIPVIAKKLSEKFGTEILDENKQIDRKKLGNIVFNDTLKMQILADITWGYMEQELDNILSQIHSYVILDWALLPNVKYWNMCTTKILITSNNIERKKKILERDGITEAYLKKRESATLDYSAFTFDYIFYNEYSSQKLHSFIQFLYLKLMENN